MGWLLNLWALALKDVHASSVKWLDGLFIDDTVEREAKGE